MSSVQLEEFYQKHTEIGFGQCAIVSRMKLIEIAINEGMKDFDQELLQGKYKLCTCKKLTAIRIKL